MIFTNADVEKLREVAKNPEKMTSGDRWMLLDIATQISDGLNGECIQRFVPEPDKPS